MSTPQRTKLADELIRRFAAALRGAQLYAPTHPLVTRNITALAETLTQVHSTTASIAIGIWRSMSTSQGAEPVTIN